MWSTTRPIPGIGMGAKTSTVLTCRGFAFDCRKSKHKCIYIHIQAIKGINRDVECFSKLGGPESIGQM